MAVSLLYSDARRHVTWPSARILWALALWRPFLCRGMYWEGEISSRGGSLPDEYAGKFVFDFDNTTDAEGNPTTVGTVFVHTYREGPPPPKNSIFFMTFDDEKDHWPQVRRNWEVSSCEEKKKRASLILPLRFDPSRKDSTQHIYIHEHLRPRVWYFTFVACGLKDPPEISYKLHAVNDFRGWQKEFSLDHTGILQLYACTSVGFVALLFGTLWATQWRRDSILVRLKGHPYLQLLLLAHCASTASCAFFLIHYLIFMNDGLGAKRIRFLGVVAGIVANCTIFLIAIFSSIGWAITSFALQGRHSFLAGVAAVGLLSALAEVHSQTTLDDSTKLYAYSSTPGMLTMIMKVFMFCWFAYQIKRTYEAEVCNERARNYYRVMGFSFTIWSLNVPVMVLLADVLSPWVRFKVVITVDVISRFVGQALLSAILCGPWSPITEDNTFSLDDDASVSAKFTELT